MENKNWMYDKEKGLYLARDSLKVDSEVEKAAEIAGVELMITPDNYVIVQSLKDIVSLVERLESPIGDTKVRIPRLSEYLRFAKTNPEFWQNEPYFGFEIVGDEEEGYKIMYFDSDTVPEEHLTIPKDYQRGSDIVSEYVRLLAEPTN